MSAPAGEPPDHPGVIAPPPLIFLSFLAVGMVAGLLWPVAVVPARVGLPAGALLALIGAGLIAAAFARFRRAGTNIQPYKPATAMVTDGPYAISRNPIYLGLGLVYGAVAVAADNPWALGLLIPAVAVMNRGVIGREERYLEAKFGDEYRRYKARVRRWL